MGQLDRRAYRGVGTALFTVCVEGRVHLFDNDAAHDVCRGALAASVGRGLWRVPAYCFMPDHVHILAEGTCAASDVWLSVVRFKCVTGEWFRDRDRRGRWQSGFDARTVESGEGCEAAALYVWNNPVRAGLVSRWQDYPYSGALL
jgi:putative transposase